MKSEQFDDIYFSVEDGLAETQHTFLDGNSLPEAWVGRDRFCICETGFGTGLNILAAWRLFEETARPDQRLDLISIEKFPLTKDQIREALSKWDLQPQLDRLLEIYPIRVRGFHRLNLTPRVTVTLIFDDVLNALPDITAQVDAWFLDGFAPAKNPDMWADALYTNMARLSAPNATIATFTAAGDVRRGLQAAGFEIEKRKGFGRKRDMVVGKFVSDTNREKKNIKTVAVIGAGIAGLSAAWHLQRAGFDVTVYEAASSIAAGASGNTAGLVNPKLTAQQSPHSDYYTSAYAYALSMIDNLGAKGALHLQADDDKARRFAGYTANLGWNADHMRLVDASEATAIAGVTIDKPCLYYPDAILASPRALCEKLAQGLNIRLNQDIKNLDDIKADAVVLANAAAAKDLYDVPAQTVRGQVTRVTATNTSKNIKANICYGGYMSPMLEDGTHVCGATFQPWSTSLDATAEDDARNLSMLAEAVPALNGMTGQGHWVGIRAASKDRFPMVGPYKDVYVTTAHSSHGMISGLLAGAYLADLLAGSPLPIGSKAAAALNPERF